MGNVGPAEPVILVKKHVFKAVKRNCKFYIEKYKSQLNDNYKSVQKPAFVECGNKLKWLINNFGDAQLLCTEGIL